MSRIYDYYQNNNYIQTITFGDLEKKAHQRNLGTFVSMLLTTFGIIAEKLVFTQLFLRLTHNLPNAPKI